MQPPDSVSPHPVDRLIVRLIREEIEASPEDVQQIVDRMASAPFNQRPVRVPAPDRGLVYGDIVIGRMADPLELHLAKRVVEEEQWTHGTTAHEYLNDLRVAVEYPGAHLVVYERSGDMIAATISPTIEIVAPARRGKEWLHNLFVVYIGAAC